MGLFALVGDVVANTGYVLQWTKQRIDYVVEDIRHVGVKNTARKAQSFLSYATQTELGQGVDDRQMRQESLISWIYSMPQGTDTQPNPDVVALEHVIIQGLWDTLPHPAPSWAHTSGPQYRKADGSGNNPSVPHVGQAGQRYIRDVVSINAETVKAQKRLHRGKGLPSPEEIFEKLYRRRRPEEGGFKRHPCGISANMFYWATLVTHDLFNTDPSDRFVNQTTSYVDLGWLYGWNKEMQTSVRDKSQYRGKLYQDVFADYRLNLQPPGVVTMALLFCRNHNWIAEQLLIRSKDDYRFCTIPKDDDHEGLKRLDEHLFQTARNINVGTFVTAVLYDYVRMLLGVNRENVTWTLPIPQDFSSAPKDLSPIGKDIPKATGNQCSIEFNFIYRWHSAISREDEEWAKRAFDKLNRTTTTHSAGKDDPFHVPTEIKKTQKRLQARKEIDPRDRDYFAFGGDLKRDPATRKYPDAKLAAFLHKGTEYAAGAFGGRQVPEVLKDVEIMGITHGRQLGVCTLNELRKLCSLREYKTFSEMSSDPIIAKSLEELYGDVSNVELYPGLVAEEAKPRATATGLCAGRTITYGILSDAVALVRGDRFLTTETNPYNLTAWGFDEVQPNKKWSFGNVLGDKLLNRHLGDHLMPRDSIYTQFMFSTPEETMFNLRRFGLSHLYSSYNPTGSTANGKV